MDRIKFFREEIGKIDKRFEAIAGVCEKEQRNRTEAEATEWQKLKVDKEALRTELYDLEAFEKDKAARALNTPPVAGIPNSQGEERERNKIAKEFRFTKLIAAGANQNSQLDGLEREMHDEAVKEAREAGVGISGMGVPAFLMKPEKRDITVGSATSAGNLVATDLADELIPALRPKLLTQALGARVITGLTSNFDIARKTAETSLTWEGENDANAEGTPTTDKIQARPNRGGVTVDVSKQLIIQSSFGVEQMVRDDISFAVAKGIDLAAISGLGSSNQPRGILNTSGIGAVSCGTPDGGAPTYAKMLEMVREAAIDNADFGALAFLGNPNVTYKLSTTPRQSSGNEGNFIMMDQNQLIGYRYASSTQVPNTLTEGAGTDLSALIFGNWNELYIFQWAGLDIVVDPYSKKTTALIEVTVNSWWDVALRHPASFVAIQDMVTS